MKLQRLLRAHTPRILRVACLLALFALAMFVWSLFDPRPIPVILAMSVGQVLGTFSLLAFLAVVACELRDEQRREKERTDRCSP
jgi:fatty acid desaturase